MKNLHYIFSFIVIFSVIPLNTAYIFNEKISFFRLFGVIFLFFVLISGKMFSGNIRNSTVRLMNWALVLILFKFLIDISFHYEDPIASVNQLLKELLTVSMLIIFESARLKQQAIEKFIIAISSIPILFGIIQMKDKTFILPKLLKNIPGIGVYGESAYYIQHANRIIGTENIAIGFALLLGILCIIFFFNYLKEKKKVHLLPVIFICIILLVYTQTRSAIYGLVPSLFISYAVINKMKLSNIILYTVLILLFVLGFGQIKELLGKHSERSTKIVDVNTYQKVSSNVWGCYGVLIESPIIGLKKKDVESAVKVGKKDLGQILSVKGDIKSSRFTVTHHNLYAYYIQYYGLLGFMLFCFIAVAIFRKIFSKTDPYDKMKLFGIFIFFFLFVLLHNNRLLLYPLLWIMLALGDENSDSDIGNNISLQ